MTSVTHLTISIDSDEAGRLTARLRPNIGREEVFLLSLQNGRRLLDLRGSLSGRLHEFHSRIATLNAERKPETFRALDEAFLDLRSIGHEFIQCFWTTAADRQRWDGVLAAAFAQSQTRDERIRIELVVDPRVSECLTIPVEIFPIIHPPGGFPPIKAIVDETSLRHALLSLPAFAGIVSRRVAKQFDSFVELEREASGRIPVKVVRNDEFYASVDDKVGASEVEWLLTQGEFDVEPPWPSADKISRFEASKRLGICLLNPKARLDSSESSKDWGDQIVHFSCHYTSTELDHSLELREDLSITVSNLNLQCDENRAIAMTEEHHRPFIFLNACGSGAAALHGGRSLVDLLIEHEKIGPRAIVATITPVAFDQAARFARRVYELLIDGWPLGEAIRLARWSLVEPGLQPFGVLYILYGSPDLHIASLVQD